MIKNKILFIINFKYDPNYPSGMYSFYRFSEALSHIRCSVTNIHYDLKDFSNKNYIINKNKFLKIINIATFSYILNKFFMILNQFIRSDYIISLHEWHIIQGHLKNILLILISRVFRKKLIMLTDYDPNLHKDLIKNVSFFKKLCNYFFLKLYDGYFTWSKFQKELLIKNLHLNKNRILSIPTCINTFEFHQSYSIKRSKRILHISDKLITITYVAGEPFGVEKILQVAPLVISNSPKKVKFIFIGKVNILLPNILKSKYLSILKKYEKNFYFTGFLKRADDKFINYLSASDILLFINRRNHVTFTKFSEFLALGRPIISSDLIGCRECIRNKNEVIFFKNDDINDLFEKIMMLINNNELRKKLCINSRKRAILSHDFLIRGFQIIEFLKNLEN